MMEHTFYANKWKDKFIFCVYGGFVASGFARAGVRYLQSDVMMLKTAVKVC